MTRSRVLFAACLAIVLTLVAAGWLWRQAPAWVAHQIHERSGGRVTVDGVELSASGVHLRAATLSSAGLTARCEGIDVPALLWRIDLPMHHVNVERCDVAEAATAGEAAASDTEGQGVRESDVDPLVQLRRYVQAVHVSAVTVHTQGAAATLTALDLTASPDGWVLSVESGTLERPEPVQLPGFQVVFAGVDSWTIEPAAALVIRGIGLNAQNVVLQPLARTATVRHGSVALDGWLVESDTMTLSLDETGRPQISGAQTRVTAPLESLPAFLRPGPDAMEGSGAAEGSVDVIPAAAQEQAAEECGEERRCRRPSELGNALTDAVLRWSQWPQTRERLLAVELPEVDVRLDGVVLMADGSDLLELSSVEFRGGTLSVSGEVLGVQLEGSAPLRTLEEVTFRAQGVDVSLAGPRVSENLRTWGTLNLAGVMVLGEQLELRVSSTLQEAGFEWGAVSPLPVQLQPLELVAEATLGADAQGDGAVRMTVEMQTGEVPLVLEGALTQDPDGWMTTWRARLASAQPCGRVWRAIPEGMLPNLGHGRVRFSGETEWTLGLDYRLGDPWSVELLSEGFPGTCQIVWVHRDFDPAELNDSDYVFHVTEGVEPPGLLVGPGTPGYVTLDSLPPYVGASMYLSEEIGFYNGVGVSLGLMRRAVAMDLDRGRYVYGGSTIMQQLVKNLYLSRAKTLSRKLEEAVIVWAMLTRVSKDRILEMYLNCIEFGPNIYGIRAASEYYFDKPPQWLTPLEAVYLANLKPSPRDGANHHRRGHSPVRGWWQERTRTILERLVEYTGSITPEEVEYYSPYILPLMGSPAWQASGYEPMERPEWAVLGLPPPGDEQVDDGSSTTAP